MKKIMSQQNEILTAAELARRTGLSRERIRQLTYPNSSANSKTHPLKDFIDNDKSTPEHCIYKSEAITFLIDRKENYKGILFVPFRFTDFINDNVITFPQLVEMLKWTGVSLREHLKTSKIRKEHYQILKEKGYEVEPYIKRRDKIDY